MKISLLAIALFCICVNANAQYKKASFNKKGVSTSTYGVTARLSLIGQSNCKQFAAAYSFGKDRNNKRFFNWHDLELVLPTKFSYDTKGDIYDYQTNQTYRQKVTVHAQAIFGFAYRYNHAFYLVDNSNEKNVVLPFVNLGANALFHITTIEGEYTTTPQVDDYTYSSALDKYPMSVPTFALGVSGGAGVLFRLSPKFALVATGGYNLQSSGLDFEKLTGESDQSTYFHYKSHPYVTFGLRFKAAGRR